MTDIDAAIEALSAIKWHSIDKDNMEFSATINYQQVDKIAKALALFRACAKQIADLRDEVALWKDRYGAELQAHEVTEKAFDDLWRDSRDRWEE